MEINDTVTAVMPSGTKKTCSFCKITLSCFANAAFIWVQDCCKKGITINSNMIQEKKWSHYDNQKQKVKDLKLEKLMSA